MNERKIATIKSIDYKDSKDILDQIQMLISRHNTLCCVEKAINESDKILEIFNLVSDDMARANNSGIGTALALTIKEANEKIHELEDEQPLENELLTKIYMLKKENEDLKNRLKIIADLVETGDDKND